jgi:hypothetical protein
MKIVLSKNKMDQIAEYRRALIGGSKKAGPRLSQVIQREALASGYMGEDQASKNREYLANLSDVDFMKLLYRTKCAVFMHERDSSTHLWTDYELNTLLPGLFSVFPDTVATGDSSLNHSYENPVPMPFCFVPAPCSTAAGSKLFKSGGSNISEIADFQDSWTVNEEKYQALMREKLGVMLVAMNNVAQEKNVLLTVKIPSLGCGAFAGAFLKQEINKLPGLIEKVLKELLENHSFPNIENVVFMSDTEEPGLECRESLALSDNRTRLLVRPTKVSRYHYFPMLADLKALLEGVERPDVGEKQRMVCLVGAGDGGSWPGNEGNHGIRSTEGHMVLNSNLPDFMWMEGQQPGTIGRQDFFNERVLFEANVQVVDTTEKMEIVSDSHSEKTSHTQGGGGASKEQDDESKNDGSTSPFVSLEDRLVQRYQNEKPENKKLLIQGLGLDSFVGYEKLRSSLIQGLGLDSAVEYESLKSFLENIDFGRNSTEVRIRALSVLGREKLTQILKKCPRNYFTDYRSDMIEAYKLIRDSEEAEKLSCFGFTKTQKTDHANRLLAGEAVCTDGLLGMISKAVGPIRESSPSIFKGGSQSDTNQNLGPKPLGGGASE